MAFYDYVGDHEEKIELDKVRKLWDTEELRTTKLYENWEKAKETFRFE